MHILNQEPIMQLPPFLEAVFAIGFIVFIIGFVVLVKADSIAVMIGSGITSVLSLIIIASIAFVNPEVETGRYKYEVTFDDTLSVEEVYDKYEVIERRGDIWVLEDKVVE